MLAVDVCKRYYTFAGVEQDPWTAPPIPYLLGGWQSGMYTYGEDGSVYAVTDTLNGSSCNESWGFAVSAHIPGGTDWAFHSPMTSQGQEMCRVGSHEKEVAVRTPGGGLLVSADANTGVIGDSITSFNQGGAVAWVRLVDDPLVEGDRLEAGGITDVESSTTGEAVVLENVSRPKECKHDRCELVQLRFLNPSDGSQAQAPVELTPPEAREREIASDLYLVPGGAIVEIAQTGGAAPPTTLIQRVAAPQVGTDLRSP